MRQERCTWRASCPQPPVGQVVMASADGTPVVIGRYCGAHLEHFGDSWARTAKASLWVEYDPVPA